MTIDNKDRREETPCEKDNGHTGKEKGKGRHPRPETEYTTGTPVSDVQ